MKPIPQYSIEWMPKVLWGKLKWAELHARAFLDRSMEGEAEWFEAFVRSVPCPKCQKHFEEFVKKHPTNLKSRVEFFMWGIDAHNHVNKATGKLEITYAHAYGIHRIEGDEK